MMKLVTIFSLAGLTLSSYVSAAPTSYAVNAGGPAYMAADGTQYEADNYFTGGGTSITRSVISNTFDQVLYQSERLGKTTYRFPVNNGRYAVKLQFAENYFTAVDKRVFDVLIENTIFLKQLDIFSKATRNKALDYTFTAEVTDGELTIDLKNATKDQPTISAIRVSPESSSLAIPGMIQAELYKEGGQGVAFNDTTPSNLGGGLRTDAVDIQATSDSGGGFNVGWIEPGEWLAYKVSVATTGVYNFSARVASGAVGTKVFHVEADGEDISGPISFTINNGWQNYSTIDIGNLPLSTKVTQLRLVFDQGSFNINYLNVLANPNALLASVRFPDPQFAACVTNMATTFGCLRAVDAHTLECPNSGIRSVSGIEIFSGLATVRLSHNQITQADFINHPNLTFISLEHNRVIQRIDVSGAPQLKTLDLWENSLTTINFNNNPLLNWLSVGENPLTPETKTYIRSLPHITSLQIDP